uniref:Uncharacterized protein n=1 Tax=Leersia perrieri TaxID=77586 RepID=A0A0D9WPY3_9ORYZ
MQLQMMYTGERSSSAAREMELMAAEQRQMGCSALGRMISSLFNCRGRMRSERMTDYGATPYHPTAQTCYVRPSTRTVAFANAHAMRPEPLQAHAVSMPPGGPPKRKKKKKKKSNSNNRVRFAAPAGSSAEPVPTDAPPPHAAHYAPAASGGQLQYPSSGAGVTQAAAAYGHGMRYAASPVARWEMTGTPRRRHEYFSSEYRWYYPTPVREGIYSLAMDANRLTTIFSEENPNACAIV